MSMYSGQVAYGIMENPLTDSPYVQQLDVGSGTPPPPEENNFLLLTGSDFLLLSGGNFELL